MTLPSTDVDSTGPIVLEVSDPDGSVHRISANVTQVMKAGTAGALRLAFSELPGSEKASLCALLVRNGEDPGALSTTENAGGDAVTAPPPEAAATGGPSSSDDRRRARRHSRTRLHHEDSEDVATDRVEYLSRSGSVPRARVRVTREEDEGSGQRVEVLSRPTAPPPRDNRGEPGTGSQVDRIEYLSRPSSPVESAARPTAPPLEEDRTDPGAVATSQVEHLFRPSPAAIAAVQPKDAVEGDGGIATPRIEVGKLKMPMPSVPPESVPPESVPLASLSNGSRAAEAPGADDETEENGPSSAVAEELFFVAKLTRDVERFEKSSFYEVLGVAADADSDEIRDGYFLQAKNFHPDRFRRFQDPEIRRIAARGFMMVEQAFNQLTKDRSQRQSGSSHAAVRVHASAPKAPEKTTASATPVPAAPVSSPDTPGSSPGRATVTSGAPAESEAQRAEEQRVEQRSKVSEKIRQLAKNQAEKLRKDAGKRKSRSGRRRPRNAPGGAAGDKVSAQQEWENRARRGEVANKLRENRLPAADRPPAVAPPSDSAPSVPAAPGNTSDRASAEDSADRMRKLWRHAMHLKSVDLQSDFEKTLGRILEIDPAHERARDEMRNLNRERAEGQQEAASDAEPTGILGRMFSRRKP